MNVEKMICRKKGTHEIANRVILNQIVCVCFFLLWELKKYSFILFVSATIYIRDVLLILGWVEYVNKKRNS